MEKSLSEKIRILSFVATCMVVWRHSLNLVAFYGDPMIAPAWLRYIEHVGSILTECAIPIFFMISGYFFSRVRIESVGSYLDLLKKKSRTLLFPFVFWNIVGLMVVIASGRFLFCEHWWDYLYRLVDSEYNGVLWYVRNLILMMLLAPLYNWLFRLDSWYAYIPILLFLFWWWWPVDMSWMSSEGWLFFFLGGVLQHKVDLRGVRSGWFTSLLFFMWIVACSLGHIDSLLFHKSIVVLGICAIWFISSSLLYHYKERILPIGSYLFLIFVLHQFVLKAMKVYLAMEFPQNPYMALGTYLLLPIVSIFVLLGFGLCWKRFSPESYSWCVGGRG